MDGNYSQSEKSQPSENGDDDDHSENDNSSIASSKVIPKRRSRIKSHNNVDPPGTVQVLIDDNGSNGRDTDQQHWIVSQLQNFSATLKPLPEVTLAAIREELANAYFLVESQLQQLELQLQQQHSGIQEDQERIVYTRVLDKYLGKVCDFEDAKEEYDTFVQELEENDEGSRELNAYRKRLVQAVNAAFEEVKFWEERCLEENSLSPARDREEPITIELDIYGSEETRFFLSPSETWHEQRETEKFILKKVNWEGRDLPPPYYDFRSLPIEERSLKELEVFTPGLIPTNQPSTLPTTSVRQESQEAMPVDRETESVGDSPISTEITYAMIQNIHNTLHQVWTQDTALENPLDGSGIRSIAYEVTWELPLFFQAHFPAGSNIRNVLTVTGGAVTSYACSCEEYMTRFFNHGRLLLDAAENLLTTKNRGEASDGQLRIVISQDANIGGRTENPYASSCTIEVNASFDDQVDIAKSILWICSAIRHSSSGLNLSRYTASLDIQADHSKLSLSPQTLEPVLFNDLSEQCWQGLFKDQVVAYGFPIPERNVGKGLELSYANMVGLARSIELVEVDNGLVAEGLTTLLVPTQKLGVSDGNALQWHLYQNRNKTDNIDEVELGLLGPKFIERLASGLLSNSYHREPDPQVLSSQRAFLGWVPYAVVTVGSSESSLKIDESGIPEIEEVRSKWTLGGNFGLATKPLPATFTFAATPSSQASAAVVEDELIMKNTLKRASDARVAILYDSNTQIGWLIPRASLILYLAQLLLHRTWQLAPADFKYAFPSPTIDGGSSASHAIWSAWEQNTPETDKMGKPKQISWLIEKICLHLQKVEGSLVQSRGEAGTTNIKAPKALIGLELLQVVHFEVSRCKVLKLNQPWTHIAEQEPLVLFCSGLGQAIRPSSMTFKTGALCLPFSKPGVGEFSDYFIGTGRTIMCLLNRNPTGDMARLSTYIRWKLNKDSPLFSLHKYQRVESYCLHAQFLESTDSRDEASEKRIKQLVQHYIDGAFAFTRLSHSNRLSTRPLRLPLASSHILPRSMPIVSSASPIKPENHIQSPSSRNSKIPNYQDTNSHTTLSDINSPSTPPTIVLSPTLHNQNPRIPVQKGQSATSTEALPPMYDQSPHKTHREPQTFSGATTNEFLYPSGKVQESLSQSFKSHLPEAYLPPGSHGLGTSSSLATVDVRNPTLHATVDRGKQRPSQTDQSVPEENTRTSKRRPGTAQDGRKRPPRESDKRQHGNGKQDRGKKP